MPIDIPDNIEDLLAKFNKTSKTAPIDISIYLCAPIGSIVFRLGHSVLNLLEILEAGSGIEAAQDEIDFSIKYRAALIARSQEYLSYVRRIISDSGEQDDFDDDKLINQMPMICAAIVETTEEEWKEGEDQNEEWTD